MDLTRLLVPIAGAGAGRPDGPATGAKVNRDDVDWRGYWVAAPTPFDADLAVDEQAFRAVLRLYLSQGVHGLLINGTTGEWFAQSPRERRQVADIAVQEVAGRVPVVIGCTSFTPAETSELAAHARDIGAAGAAATPPPYAHPTDAEVVEFFRAVTAAVEMPWMVYNWPRGTAVDLAVSTCVRLAGLDGIVALKDSTADELKSAETCAAVAGSVRFFGRFIHRRGMALARELGGDGTIDGGGLGAAFAAPYFEALWRDDLDTARTLGAAYTSLMTRLITADYSGRFASPTAQLKAAMNLLGQPGGRVRPPLANVDDVGTLQALGAALQAGGLSLAVARGPH
jgi:4-hydroxy-tetrahydrodipicolinate synthase